MASPPRYSYDLSVKSSVSDEIINVYVIRPLAGILVRFLYITPITPNLVTIAATVAGMSAAVLFFFDTSTTTILAGGCILLKDILDSADGQLARAKNMISRAGRFLDSIGDFAVNLLVFAAIGYVLGEREGNAVYLLLALLCFLGITFRVSYHVFYQTSFLHLQKRYNTNRITEELRAEDFASDRVTLLLQRTFQLLYGWQDRMMVRLDRWCRKPHVSSLTDVEWFADRMGLRLSGFIGMGTELFLLAGCSVANRLDLYLLCNLLGMNVLLLASIWYRRSVLAMRSGSS